MKTKYKIDTHVHTAEVSSCGKVKSDEIIRLYLEHRYDTIIITDHYFRAYFDTLNCSTWEEKIDNYLSGYKSASIAGERLGLNVIPGMEIRFDNSPNDYLVYGISRDILCKYPELYKMQPAGFYALCRENGMAVFQAHPFRANMTVEDSANIDGIEVYNGHPRHNSNNSAAYRHAAAHNLGMLSGSDFHQVQDIARGGIVCLFQPADSKEFAEYILEEKNPVMLGDIDLITRPF